MKLKKIASLMLAGVMAASMLTACGDANNIDDTQKPEEPDTTPATGYSATFEGRLGSLANSKISMSDSDALNSALQAAMEFAADNNIAYDYDNNQHNTVTFVNPKNNNTADLKVVATELINKADDKKEGMNLTEVSDVDDLLKPSNNDKETKYYKNDDVDIVMLFVVDGGLSTNAAVMEVADKLDATIADLTRAYTYNANSQTSEAMYTYTGSVSADTITLDADHGKSMTFVAVEIVRELA